MGSLAVRLAARRIDQDPLSAADTRKTARTNDASTWATFAEALAAYQENGDRFDGIGYVFSPDDPFVGWDLDNCISNGELLDWVHPYIARMMPTYAEVSPSGCGIKGIARGSLPGKGTRRSGVGPDSTGAIEMYDRGRFFTLTGDIYGTDSPAIEDRSGPGRSPVQESRPGPGTAGDAGPAHLHPGEPRRYRPAEPGPQEPQRPEVPGAVRLRGRERLCGR